MTETPHILIVDDERTNRAILERMLNEAGFHIITASSGPEGRRMAASAHPDLIILDIMMPGESGFDTCTQLLSDPATSEIPIIFISGLADVEAKVRGLKLGAVDYITKPFALVEVLARVKLHIRLKRASKSLIQEQAAKLQQIREAQQAILARPEDLPEANFSISYIPVLEAGGDFYDVFHITENEIGYFVADISDHDLGASFATSSLKALVRQNSGPLFTPTETIKNINSVLATLFRDGRHLTASLVSVNRKRLWARAINAGHPPPLLARGNGLVEDMEAAGDILGVFKTIRPGFAERQVASGDRIFLYTDGLIERFDQAGFSRGEGLAELRRLCSLTRHLPLPEAVGAVIEKLLVEDQPPQDDIVLLGLEI
jgi:phosphoserine phosphatase RsbU/P